MGRSIGGYFFSVSVVPSLVLVIGAWLIFTADPFGSSSPMVDNVSDAVMGVEPQELASISAASLFVALLSHPFQVGLIKSFEGYMATSGGRRLGRWGMARQARRSARLTTQTETLFQAQWHPDDEVDRPPDLQRLFEDALARPDERDLIAIRLKKLQRMIPERHRLLASSFGNVLRAGEDQAGNRYGLDAVELSPYLALVGPEISSRLTATRILMERQLRLVVSLGTLSLLSVVAFIDDGPWLFIAPLTACLALVAYHGATQTGRFYVNHAGRLVDVHRFDLLNKFGLPMPTNPDEEQKMFKLLMAELKDRSLMQSKDLNQLSQWRSEANKAPLSDNPATQAGDT